MKILADASNVIAEGEVMQLVNCNDPSTNESHYMETILRKTATLFEAAAELGAVVSNQDEATCSAMAQYGLHVGMAFQLVDDALDYGFSDKDIGKNIGDDLAEGKPTLPLIHVLQHGSKGQIKLVEQAIKNSSADNLTAIKAAIEDTKALDYTLAAAEKQVTIAIECLAKVPESQYKTGLIALAQYAVARQF